MLRSSGDGSPTFHNSSMLSHTSSQQQQYESRRIITTSTTQQQQQQQQPRMTVYEPLSANYGPNATISGGLRASESRLYSQPPIQQQQQSPHYLHGGPLSQSFSAPPLALVPHPTSHLESSIPQATVVQQDTLIMQLEAQILEISELQAALNQCNAALQHERQEHNNARRQLDETEEYSRRNTQEGNERVFGMQEELRRKDLELQDILSQIDSTEAKMAPLEQRDRRARTDLKQMEDDFAHLEDRMRAEVQRTRMLEQSLQQHEQVYRELEREYDDLEQRYEREYQLKSTVKEVVKVVEVPVHAPRRVVAPPIVTPPPPQPVQQQVQVHSQQQQQQQIVKQVVTRQIHSSGGFKQQSAAQRVVYQMPQQVATQQRYLTSSSGGYAQMGYQNLGAHAISGYQTTGAPQAYATNAMYGTSGLISGGGGGQVVYSSPQPPVQFAGSGFASPTHGGRAHQI